MVSPGNRGTGDNRANGFTADKSIREAGTAGPEGPLLSLSLYLSTHKHLFFCNVSIH